jgi:GYF domain 2
MTSLEPEIWFFVRDGRRVGPFNRTGLLRELLVQESPEAALVWRSGLPTWTKASLLDDLRRDLPPPLPGSSPGTAPTLEPSNLVMPELPETSEDATASLEAPSPESSLSGGDVSGEAGEDPAAKEEARTERRRKRRRRHEKTRGLPGYAIPLFLLFVAVMIGLWFLLRRMNEVPPGRIILQGASRPLPATPLIGCRPDATPA